VAFEDQDGFDYQEQHSCRRSELVCRKISSNNRPTRSNILPVLGLQTMQLGDLNRSFAHRELMAGLNEA
jgi:hypothetical protein